MHTCAMYLDHLGGFAQMGSLLVPPVWRYQRQRTVKRVSLPRRMDGIMYPGTADGQGLGATCTGLANRFVF